MDDIDRLMLKSGAKRVTIEKEPYYNRQTKSWEIGGESSRKTTKRFSSGDYRKKDESQESEFDALKRKLGYRKLNRYQSDNVGANLKNWIAIMMAYSVLGFKGFAKTVATQIENHGGSGGGNGGGDGGNFFNNMKGNFMKISGKSVFLGLAFAVAAILAPMTFGINDAGQRTVIQYPSGTIQVKFEPGLYAQWFGKTTEYSDVLTFDFDKDQDGTSAIEQNGIQVRYQDGGTGTVYGKARFRLPSDLESMKDIHKEFRTNDGVSHKLIKSVVEETMNHTAGLMSSEQSYAEMRGTYAEWARDQLERGKYQTQQNEITTVEAGFEFCLEPTLTKDQEDECENVKRTTKIVPVIRYVDGLPVHTDSDVEAYSIDVSGFQMVDWDYEKKTLDQIAAKREATMAIITSKANAERAKQDAITAEQQGLANVQVAKYEKEVEKTKAVVDAQREKEVAVVAAQRGVEVAEQQKLEAEQLKLAAAEYKQERILRGQGDAAYKKAVLEADGALQQKLETYERVAIGVAKELSKQKWSPEIVMGGGDSGNTGVSQVDAFMQMLTTNAAKELALDMKIKK